MTTLRILFYSGAAALALIMLGMAVRSKKPLSVIAAFSGLGVGSLFAVVVFGAGFGIGLGFNWYTIGTSAVLGLPGTVAMVLGNMILR